MSDNSALPAMNGTDFQPLRVSGIPVVQTYPQIVNAVRRTLGPEHAALFAEPNIDSTTGDIQWYPRVSGQARLFSALGPQERDAAELRLARLVNDIHCHADTLADSKQPADHIVAENLRLALEVPDTGNVALVGDQPVLYGWGHVPRGEATPRHLLRVLAERRLEAERKAAEDAAMAAEEEARRAHEAAQAPPRSAIEPAPPFIEGHTGVERTGSGRFRLHIYHDLAQSLAVVRRSWGWLLPFAWVVFSLLMLAIGWLLLKHCALGWPSVFDVASRPFLDYCRIETAVRNDDAPIAALRQRLAQLDEQLRNRKLACVPPPPPPPPPPQQRGETEKRLEEQGGRIGAVNIVLTWNTDDDLDLYATCPGGMKIGYTNKVACGGKHDLDRNAGEIVPKPIENIVWETGAAPAGKYTVEVNRYTARSSEQRPTAYTVELKIDGATVQTRTGEIAVDKVNTRVLEFELPWVRRN